MLKLPLTLLLVIILACQSRAEDAQPAAVKEKEAVVLASNDLITEETGHHGHYTHGAKHGSHGHWAKHGGELMSHTLATAD